MPLVAANDLTKCHQCGAMLPRSRLWLAGNWQRLCERCARVEGVCATCRGWGRVAGAQEVVACPDCGEEKGETCA